MKTNFLLPLFFLPFASPLFSQSNINQSLSINSTGAAADASAQLDVSANNKGVLVPRMTSLERIAIASPATGLLVFDTNSNTFWFFNGAAWVNIAPQSSLTDADGDTKVQVEESPDEDVIRFDIGGTENMALRKNAGGIARLELMNTAGNTFFGENAGLSNTAGTNNTVLGRNALSSNTSGFSSVAMGKDALFSNTARPNLVAVGDSALYHNGTGAIGNFEATGNTAVGSKALVANTRGYQNTAMGYQTLFSNTTGFYNTANGYQALYSNTTGSFNTANGRLALYSNTTAGNNTATGVYALRYNTTGWQNTAYGLSALEFNMTGSNNTATGYQSLYNNETGDGNTSTGYRSLRNNTVGNDNTATGAYALENNTSGDRNTAIGEQALYSNSTGEENTASGNFALHDNTTGHRNTANGKSAMSNNTTGDNNTASGYEALVSNTTGYFNTVCGAGAMYFNTIGFENTAFGRGAGSLNNNNRECTFIGNDASQTTYTDFVNSTALGSESRITASHQVRVGNSAVTSIGGYEGWTNLSDGRFKRNLSEDVPGLPFILALRPVTYNLDVHGLAAHLQEDRIEDFEKRYGETLKRPSAATLQSREAKSYIRRTGFVAQEVEQAAQTIGYDFSGVDKPQNEESLYGLRYAEFVVPLVKAVQEQQKIIQNGEWRMKNLEKENAALRMQLDKITAALAGAGIAVEK